MPGPGNGKPSLVGLHMYSKTTKKRYAMYGYNNKNKYKIKLTMAENMPDPGSGNPSLVGLNMESLIKTVAISFCGVSCML